MCLLRKKLILFDYTIGKLVEWKQKENPEMSVDACLKELSGIRLMKLLYFVCLASVKEEVEDVQKTLLGIFDNYLAYENGPVEVDAYNNRASLFHYRFVDNVLQVSSEYRKSFEYEFGLFEDEFKVDDPFKTLIAKEKLTDQIKMIDDSFDLLEEKKVLVCEETQNLVNLSHNLKLWNEANKSNGKLSVDNIYLLKEETNLFKALMA